MKPFELLDKITVSEFQRILMFLDGHCDYQVALKTMRDGLGATKEKNRYWILSHAEVWCYLDLTRKDKLKQRKIEDMGRLIKEVITHFDK
ncbi:hypothetical protein [Desulfosporosinus sp. OT]|uniref:hypothetical protein n=1 Tax=Desulfosporosinus sp. OT TaxID=913865 RepID=UPI0002239CE2|nr:hypothetical protein [Desulfosporosinus sp. OT]EGW39341.1 hypothetical protein DOT_2626 [Desulfosporosinus sp. OT]